MHPFVHCRSHMCMCRCRCRCMCLRDCMRARVLTCTRAKQATSGARSYRPKKARMESSCADRCRMIVPASRSLTSDLIPSNGDLKCTTSSSSWDPSFSAARVRDFFFEEKCTPRSSPWDPSFSAARVRDCESGRERAGGGRAAETGRGRESQEEAGREHVIKAPHCLWHVPQTNWSVSELGAEILCTRMA